MVMMMFVDVPIDGLDVKSPMEEGVEEVINNKDGGYREEDVRGGHLSRVPYSVGLVIQIPQEKVNERCSGYPIHPDE